MSKIALFEKKILLGSSGTTFPFGEKPLHATSFISAFGAGKLPNNQENNKLVSGKNSYNRELPCVFSYTQQAETLLTHRFIKFITKKGKKSTAEFILSQTFNLLGKKLHKSSEGPKVYSTALLGKSRKPNQKFPEINNGLSDESNQVAVLTNSIENSEERKSFEPISIFTVIHKAIENVKPFFEVKKVRVAGTTVQVPSLIQPDRQENLAINWILQSATERKKKIHLKPLKIV